MREYTEDARQEIKRAEHLIYVSLKYTRTVDVIKNIIERLINAYKYIIDDMLTHFKDRIKTPVPQTPPQKCELLKQTLKPDETNFIESLEFYTLLRKLSRADFKRINEFRRHVTMIAEVDGKEKHIDIDTITEYYHYVKNFAEQMNQLLQES